LIEQEAGQRCSASILLSEFFAPCCLAGKKRCLGILALSAEFERAEILEPGTFGDIPSGLQPDPETVEVVEAHVTVVHAIANGCADARPGLDLGRYSPKTRRPNSSPNRLAGCGSLAARKRPASSKKAFSFCFRGLLEHLQEDRHRIASCLVDSPLVPDVSHGVSTKHHLERSHLTRSAPRIKSGTSVAGPRRARSSTMGPNQSRKKVSRDHHSFPNPRVRYRVQHIRQKIHCDVGQSNRQDAALDQVVVAV
jgi:hypothetical protein